jgi:hypothetical protein
MSLRQSDKQIVVSLDGQFALIHRNSYALVEIVEAECLFRRPGREVADRGANEIPASGETVLPSCAEWVIRAAAAVEQAFGGITANLWDDPFEWTLAETLSTPALLIEYLDETEMTRRRAFDFIETDAVLMKEIAVPSGEMKILFELMLETLGRAAHYQGRAFATARLFSSTVLPRV